MTGEMNENRVLQSAALREYRMTGALHVNRATKCCMTGTLHVNRATVCCMHDESTTVHSLSMTAQ